MTGMNLDDKPVRCFMDGVDWQHELGEASGGNSLYPRQEDLESHRPCVSECGIVEVEVRLVRWVAKQDFHRCERDHGGHDWGPATGNAKKVGFNEVCDRCGCARHSSRRSWKRFLIAKFAGGKLRADTKK